MTKRTTMNMSRAAILSTLLLAGCAVKSSQSSYLEITKTLVGTFTAGTTANPQGTCTVDPGAKEFDILSIDPTASTGHVAPLVVNNLQNNQQLSVNRLNTNDFTAHNAVVDYEVLPPGGGSTTLPRQVVPAHGSVPAGGTGTVGTFFFPAGGGFPTTARTVIRVSYHIEGNLVDGSNVHTNQNEALFVVCTSGTAGCPTSQCL